MDSRKSSQSLGMHSISLTFLDAIGIKTPLDNSPIKSAGLPQLPFFNGEVKVVKGPYAEIGYYDFSQACYVSEKIADKIFQRGFTGTTALAVGLSCPYTIDEELLFSMVKTVAKTPADIPAASNKISSILEYLAVAKVLHFTEPYEPVTIPRHVNVIASKISAIPERTIPYNEAKGIVSDLAFVDYKPSQLIKEVLSVFPNKDGYNNDFVHALVNADKVLLPQGKLFRILNANLIEEWDLVSQPPITGAINDKDWFIAPGYKKGVKLPIPPTAYRLFIYGNDVNLRSEASKISSSFGKLALGDIVYQTGDTKNGFAPVYSPRKGKSGFVATEYVYPWSPLAETGTGTFPTDGKSESDTTIKAGDTTVSVGDQLVKDTTSTDPNPGTKVDKTKFATSEEEGSSYMKYAVWGGSILTLFGMLYYIRKKMKGGEDAQQK